MVEWMAGYSREERDERKQNRFLVTKSSKMFWRPSPCTFLSDESYAMVARRRAGNEGHKKRLALGA